MAGLCSSGFAAEEEQTEELPDLEFLEFLGRFETDSGEWMDPDSLLTEEFTELLDVSTDAAADSDSSNTDDATDNN